MEDVPQNIQADWAFRLNCHFCRIVEALKQNSTLNWFKIGNTFESNRCHNDWDTFVDWLSFRDGLYFYRNIGICITKVLAWSDASHASDFGRLERITLNFRTPTLWRRLFFSFISICYPTYHVFNNYRIPHKFIMKRKEASWPLATIKFSIKS